jgi:GLPGLI family protein
VIHFSSKAQKEEGQITYDITYLNLPEEAMEYEKMMPDKMILSFKGTKTRSETKGGMSMTNQTTIYNGETEELYTLVDMMGNKAAVMQSKEDLEEEDNQDYEVIHLDETKEIAGYHCKKAIVKDDKGNEYTVYYAPDLDFQGEMQNTPYDGEI